MDFIKARTFWYSFSLVTTIIGVLAFLFLPKNLGIDMTGGVMLELKSSGSVSTAIAQQAVAAIKDMKFEGAKIISEATVYPVTGENLVRAEVGFSSDIPEKKLEDAKTFFRKETVAVFQKLSVATEENRYSDIGQSFGEYVKKTAYITLMLAIVAIAFYVAWSFRSSVEGISSFSLGFITIITLFHDVLVAGGLYVIISYFLPEFKFDSFTVTALLTILGYSINDTIVILDRVRATVQNTKTANMPLDKLVNTSVNSVLVRSLYTPLTLLIVLLSLFIFGPEVIRGFILVLLLGTVVGTYSSVCVSAPLVYDINKKVPSKK